VKKGRVAAFARFLAWTYLVALVALVLVLRFVGEGFWLVVPVMYLPRVLFALPLVVTLPAIVYAGPRRMLLTQLASVLLVLFPLMGLELHPFTPPADAAAPKLRLMTFNVFFGNGGCAAILDEVAAHDPDVVVFQASTKLCDRALHARFPVFDVEAASEFVIGSKFPVTVHRPDAIMTPRPIGPGFMGYTLDTPLGAIDLYSVHPYSPRHALESARESAREGAKETARGESPADDPHLQNGRIDVEANTSDRQSQVAAIAAAAARSTNPVIIAGDTNLPALSRIYARSLASGSGRWKDGFAAVGNGFGYTFPTHWKHLESPWMRLDRILAGPGLRFLSFEVGGRGASDHSPVIADLAASP